MKNKGERGLSTIVVTLLMILLSLVAIGVVWVVVSNILKSGTQQASSGLGQLFISLELQNVNIKPNGDMDISVKRNVGQGDLTGINFIVSDGVNTKIIKKDTTLQELNSNTFTIIASELGSNFGLIKEISIAPVIGSTIGNPVDKKEFSNKDILKGLGAVSWWKLDGNANDEIGGNSGNIIGSVNFVQGKSGQAASFDGGSNYIRLTTFSNLPLGSSPRTMLAWINPSGYLDGTYNGIVAYGTIGCTSLGSLLSIKNNGMLSQAFWCNDALQTSGNSVNLNNWNFVAFTYGGGTTVNFYINGNSVQQVSLSAGVSAATTSGPLRIGCTDDPGRCFKGNIEDVIIFNQSLTAQQIKSLYQLDLTSS